MTTDALKAAAAAEALKLVENGMRLGLGTGSTAKQFVDLLGARVKAGLDVVCVATSLQTETQARGLGIRVVTLDAEPELDLTVDGADEIDAELRLIKGGGGALLREKIVAAASDRMIVIADTSKKVETLGRFPLPIEVVKFGLAATTNMIEALAAEVGCTGDIRVRTGANGTPFVTDNGNLILDCAFGRIPEPDELAEILTIVPGVVETGLFLGYCDLAFLAGPNGVERLETTLDF
ncbi:MAG: ribose-5-phosphate isomerase RpiA [Hyphomicrobiaceae bacterium]